MKLPRLSAVEQAQALLVELLVVEIDSPGHADVLLDPRVLDRLRADAEEALGQIAEGAMAHLLDAENVLDLAAGEDALLDEKLTDLNSCWHCSTPGDGAIICRLLGISAGLQVE